MKRSWINQTNLGVAEALCDPLKIPVFIKKKQNKEDRLRAADQEWSLC